MAASAAYADARSDHWARLDRLLWNNDAPAARRIYSLVDPGHAKPRRKRASRWRDRNSAQRGCCSKCRRNGRQIPACCTNVCAGYGGLTATKTPTIFSNMRLTNSASPKPGGTNGRLWCAARWTGAITGSPIASPSITEQTERQGQLSAGGIPCRLAGLAVSRSA